MKNDTANSSGSAIKGRRILVTGGAGFLGRHVCRRLREFEPTKIIVPRSAEWDLRQPHVIQALIDIERPDVIVHLAAVVGGIGANRENPGRYFYENAVMGIHLMEQARLAGVEKMVSVGTICSYPKFTPVPFREEDLWIGYPEETNAPYGLAKKMLLVQGQAYRQQYGFNAVTLLPVNLYGPGDNFDPSTSHVIPALIRKVFEAMDEGRESIDVWGTGSASREFLFVRDAAEAICLATDRYDSPEPVNLGSGSEISIRELVETICELCEFKGEIRWDHTKPDGQPRRCLDTTRADESFGFRSSTSLRDGLLETISWWKNYRNTGSEPVAESPRVWAQPKSVGAAAVKPATRRALITGISGQDGSYLTEFLLERNYEVHGIVRRSSSMSRVRLDEIVQHGHAGSKPVLHYGDMTDASSLMRLVLELEPDEIYNLAAQSHVRVSFDNPTYTVQVAALGALHLLEAARLLNKRRPVRYYQASTSEMFGGAPDTAPQSERTPFHPRSPYGCAKAYAHHQTVNFRESYDMFACCGILFNHESPRRGESFVTRKITLAAARIYERLQRKLMLGNLDAKRDWGYAKDYVEAMWLMLQQETPEDYVIATGETHSVKEFLQLAFEQVGLDWQQYVELDPRYYRPAEVDLLLGDATKAREKLGWVPGTSFQELIRIMIDHDVAQARREKQVQGLSPAEGAVYG